MAGRWAASPALQLRAGRPGGGARAAPSIPRGLLAARLPDDWDAALTGLGCTTLHLAHQCVRTSEIRELTAIGVPVLLYTVNQPARARELLAAGAVAVITDVPDVLLAAQ